MAELGRDLDPADGLAVHGGAGGTTAFLDDLDAAAGRLAETAAELTGWAAQVLAVAADPMLLGSYLLAPATGLPAELAVAGAAAGPHGLAPAAAAVGALALSLRAASEAYRQGDGLAAVAVRRLSLAAGAWARWVLGPVAVGVVATGNGERLVDLLGRAPGAGDAVAELLPGALAVRDPRELARALGLLGVLTPWLRDSGRVRGVVGAPRTGAAPSGLADLLARTEALSARRGAAPGAVRVERVVGAGGGRSWIVQLPGTQSWAPRPGANPFDLSAGVATLAGRRSAVGSLVVQALRGCGARPGEPVLLVGHSLGGMAAAQLAADPQLRREVTITHVVTAGSPIALSGVPDEVRVLALEHDQDPVAWLDGAANPDRPRWVTVGAPAAGGAGGSHELSGYVELGAAVDASHDPGLARWREGLSVFLARPGATSSSWEVTGERVTGGQGGVAGPG
jgi:hypothetical protein